MSGGLVNLVYEIELQPGEKLTLPKALVESIGSGHWLLSVQPALSPSPPVRSHRAFLNSFAPEDEGLYDDTPGR